MHGGTVGCVGIRRFEGSLRINGSRSVERRQTEVGMN